MNNDNEKKSKRSSNFELLRIFSIFMIVVYHITMHCVAVQLKGGDSVVKAYNVLFNSPIFYKKLFYINAAMPLGNTGNLIFFLISGYFLVDKPINIFKISKKLLLQLLFAWIVLIVGSTIVFMFLDDSVNVRLMNLTMYLNSNRLWYVGYYFGVILLAYLFLNKWFNTTSQKSYLNFVLILFAITQFSWFKSLITDISGQLIAFVVGVFSFSLGGYIKKYEPFKKVRITSIIMLILLCFGLIYISSYNITQTNIRNYTLNNSSDLFIQEAISFEKINIVVIILSICIFELFSRIRMPYSRFINLLGASTFMVYLIHDNDLFYGLWAMKDWTNLLFYSPLKYVQTLLLYALVICVIGFIFYLIYLLIHKLFSVCKYVFIRKSN